MRSVMTVGELKRYCEGRSMRRILFCTENQKWDTVENPMKANLVFSSILIACNPNIICLKAGENMLYFERVKCVNVDTERSILGTVLDVVCGDSTGKTNDVHYTLIAS